MSNRAILESVGVDFKKLTTTNPDLCTKMLRAMEKSNELTLKNQPVKERVKKIKFKFFSITITWTVS